MSDSHNAERAVFNLGCGAAQLQGTADLLDCAISDKPKSRREDGIHKVYISTERISQGAPTAAPLRAGLCFHGKKRGAKTAIIHPAHPVRPFAVR